MTNATWNVGDAIGVHWPKVLIDRCEENYYVTPWIAEFGNALTALVIAASGLFSLWSSTYSDDVLDLASATIVINGVTSALSHGTLLRVFGQIDAITVTLFILIYVKASVLAHVPQLNASPSGRSILNLLVMSGVCLAIAWNPSNLPPNLAETLVKRAEHLDGCVAEAYLRSCDFWGTPPE